MGKVGITDTILRDAHQSQAATRMRTGEMLEAAAVLLELAAPPPQPTSRPAVIAAARVRDKVFFVFMFFPPSKEKHFETNLCVRSGNGSVSD